jgi:hypothetical protein
MKVKQFFSDQNKETLTGETPNDVLVGEIGIDVDVNVKKESETSSPPHKKALTNEGNKLVIEGRNTC